jgi:hypothetical protein
MVSDGKPDSGLEDNPLIAPAESSSGWSRSHFRIRIGCQPDKSIAVQARPVWSASRELQTGFDPVASCKETPQWPLASANSISSRNRSWLTNRPSDAVSGNMPLTADRAERTSIWLTLPTVVD